MRWTSTLLVLALVGIAAIAGWRLTRGDGAASTQPHSGQSAQAAKHPQVSPQVGAAASTRPKPSSTSRGSSQPSSSTPTSLPPATSSADEPLTGVMIAIDPGHNGGNAIHPEEIARLVPAGANGTTKACNTTGTETNDGLLTEAQFNWDVAMDLMPRLEALGGNVVLTRHSNDGVGPCVNERAEIANRAHAAVDVAIHADGNESEGAHGFDVIHASTAEMVAPATAGASRKLAEDLRDALVQSGVPPANYVGHEGLDARSDLAGLNLARVPAVLVELGNMRSASEAAKLEDRSYRRKLAGAITAGILSFLHR